MGGEAVVGRTGLQHVNVGEAAVADRFPEDVRHVRDVPRERARDEGRFQREDEIHGIQRFLGYAVRRGVHRLVFHGKCAGLGGGEPVIAVVVQYENDWIMTAYGMHQVSDALGKTGTVAAESHHFQLRIYHLRSGCERDHAAVEAMHAIAAELVRHVAVAADVVTEERFMRTYFHLDQRAFEGGPDAVIAAYVAPGADIP